MAVELRRTDTIDRLRRVPWWVVVGVVALVAGFARSALCGVTSTDEAWFLYVLHRVDAGGVLYRDVWAPMFPLSVWLGTAFTRLFGEHVFVLKAVDSLVFAGTAIATVSVARRISPRRGHPLLLLAALLGWAAPGVVGPGSLYTALSFALLMATLAVTLSWVSRLTEGGRGSIPLLLAAAALAGLSFSAKQTTGAFAVVALGAAVLFVERRHGTARIVSRLAAMAAVFVAIIAATVLPVVLSGGFPALIADTFPTTTNVASVSAGAFPYWTGLQWFGHQLARPMSGWWVYQVTLWAAYVFPFLAAPLFVWALARRRDLLGAILTLFCAAGLAVVAMRADYAHLAAALPLLLLACVYAWEVLAPRPTRPIRTAIAVLLVMAVGVRLVSAVAEPFFRSGPQRRVETALPHFQGAPLSFSVADDGKKAIAELRSSSAKAVFILSLRAGFLYLGSGRENPTPYDYPDGMTSAEQKQVIEAVKTGRVDAIWFDPMVALYAYGRTTELISYMRTAMRPIGTPTPWGRLYVPATSAQ
jgi:hypothetical protein